MTRLLSVILVCVYSVCMCVAAQSAKAALPRDYGVKLCGREFIRAVIFTCGGSRWRRSLDLDLPQSSENSPFLLGSYTEPSDRDDELAWARAVELAAAASGADHPSLLSSSPSLEDLLQVMDDHTQMATDVEPSERLRGQLPWDPWGGAQARNPTVHWPLHSRRKRNFSLGLAGMCCNQGCTKNDIGRLC